MTLLASLGGGLLGFLGLLVLLPGLTALLGGLLLPGLARLFAGLILLLSFGANLDLLDCPVFSGRCHCGETEDEDRKRRAYQPEVGQGAFEFAIASGTPSLGIPSTSVVQVPCKGLVL